MYNKKINRILKITMQNRCHWNDSYVTIVMLVTTKSYSERNYSIYFLFFKPVLKLHCKI